MTITIFNRNSAKKGFHSKFLFHLIKKMDSLDFLNESLRG
ncbi:hypothetical protein STND_1195 [Streptococcus thermophilus ND03]|nr:hypothetical protein STND_1195 [Streptococcus thermophilus ND03]AFJ83610.1 hypothetical protein Y1U_C1161 [Streptococcus thermophilus MN-ZLW-002]AKB97864.1 hypothetical protein SMQ301_1244 [Streptococcus thermophilus]AOZ59680.1 hypothetical protein BBD27_1596 [Streptococcus thermophilus]KPL38189.1 hypothetical protein ADU38_77 [Streptococcus thermophilus]